MVCLARSMIVALGLLFAFGQTAALAAPCTLIAPAPAPDEACPHHASHETGHETGGNAGKDAPDAGQPVATCLCLVGVIGLPAPVAAKQTAVARASPQATPPLLSVGWRAPPDPPRPKHL